MTQFSECMLDSSVSVQLPAMTRLDWAYQWCRMDDEGGPVTVSYGRRESFVLADDMSDFFGTQRSIDGTFSLSITAYISA